MDNIDARGKLKITVFRADGSGWREEQHRNPKDPDGMWPNLFTNEGMNYLAAFQSTSPGSVMNHMIVGTVSTAATLTDVATTMGEVDRNTMATRVAAANVLTEVCTFAGGLDSITSLSLREVGVINDARSGGFGSLRSRSVFASVILAASDFLNISYATTCGSR